LCGGGTKLSLWNRSMAAPMTVYNCVEDSGIHVTKLMDETLYAGGCSKYFYQLSFTDEILCKIETSPVTVFSCVNQENPFKVSFKKKLLLFYLDNTIEKTSLVI